MRRFFINPEAISADSASITGSDAHHIRSVLRLQPGVTIELFDGTGAVYHAIITTLGAKNIQVKILKKTQVGHISQNTITLGQGLLKGKKMDFLVQKATEMGVDTFWPIQTRFSENRGKRDRQMARWQRIMVESCKQCNRAVPMQIHPVTDLGSFLSSHFETKLLFWEKEQSTILSPELFQSKIESLALLLGPEGGFYETEVEEARENNFKTISLGRLTLRAETAALSVVAISQYILGNLRPDSPTLP